MSRFSDYATNVAFRVELTRAQLAVMLTIVNRNKGVVIATRDHLSAWRALEGKGIIEHRDSQYHLTKEGELMVPLLRVCGLLDIQKIKAPSRKEFERAGMDDLPGK